MSIDLERFWLHVLFRMLAAVELSVTIPVAGCLYPSSLRVVFNGSPLQQFM